jgi:hypothetical protein
MYVIAHHPSGTAMLHELDKKGLKLAKRAYPRHDFEVVSGLRAHRWVREDFPHSTPLYVEHKGGRRIRYARDAS